MYVCVSIYVCVYVYVCVCVCVCVCVYKIFPSGSVIKNPPARQEMWIQSWVMKIPQRRT